MLCGAPVAVSSRRNRGRCLAAAHPSVPAVHPPPPPAASLESMWLPAAPQLNQPPRTWSPAALAYLGDSVWEVRWRGWRPLSPLTRPFQLYARRHYFAPARQHATYVSQVSQLTRAEGQAKALSSLLPLLQPEELAVVKWGRNAQIGKVPDRLRCVPLESATGAPPPLLVAAHMGVAGAAAGCTERLLRWKFSSGTYM